MGLGRYPGMHKGNAEKGKKDAEALKREMNKLLEKDSDFRFCVEKVMEKHGIPLEHIGDLSSAYYLQAHIAWEDGMTRDNFMQDKLESAEKAILAGAIGPEQVSGDVVEFQHEKQL
ncbi:MAG: hypothetical protein FWE31_05495 [Firmicutes bacterium]|nr:hypothetical protein [Bacillota bacterium]